MRALLRSLRAVGAVALLAGVTAPATAQNLIQNRNGTTLVGWAYTNSGYPFDGPGVVLGNCTALLGTSTCFSGDAFDRPTPGWAQWAQVVTPIVGVTYRASLAFRTIDFQAGQGGLRAVLRVGGQEAVGTCPVGTICTLAFDWLATSASTSYVVRVERLAPATSASSIVWSNALLADVTTIPEPSTYALLGGGLLALAGIARRRRA